MEYPRGTKRTFGEVYAMSIPAASTLSLGIPRTAASSCYAHLSQNRRHWNKGCRLPEQGLSSLCMA